MLTANIEVLGDGADDWPEQLEFQATPAPGQSVVLDLIHEGRVREVMWWVVGAACELWITIQSCN